MSQLVETAFRCGDGEALMTYVYGESSPTERDAIAAHVAWCGQCADEVAAVGSAREQLAAWTPPFPTLGFQITRGAELSTEPGSVERPPAASATVIRPAAWWNRPLPAWAQMAAAVVIFASGLAIGVTRTPAAPPAVAQKAPSVTAQPVVATTSAVTRDELARVEQRLKTEMAQMRTAAPAAAEPPSVTLQRVNQLIAASEERQQRELEFRTAQIVRDVSNRRQIDLANIEQRFGATAVKVLDNQRYINSLAQRVAYPASSPYVP
jgi:anti-sigma factor RsiW